MLWEIISSGKCINSSHKHEIGIPKRHFYYPRIFIPLLKPYPPPPTSPSSPPYAAVFFSKHSPLTSMAGGESGTHVPSLATFRSLEKQFEEFRHQLEDSGSLRERIRSVALEIESATRLMHSSLLLIHQSRPVPEVLETAKEQIGLMRELFSRLAEITRECPGQYYRYHGDWRSETQTVVSLLAFMHWLETGSLLLHTEAEEKLGCMSNLVIPT
ncbi:UNVERIFIED_CONTAM: hypothetical protein Sradi_3422400 [Sesamum radiatum]|uniref:Translin n=1 Tax=Sesamum radiatum TaxID=300843 RepID=A0AAW2R4L2_SESRA